MISDLSGNLSFCVCPLEILAAQSYRVFRANERLETMVSQSVSPHGAMPAGVVSCRRNAKPVRHGHSYCPSDAETREIQVRSLTRPVLSQHEHMKDGDGPHAVRFRLFAQQGASAEVASKRNLPAKTGLPGRWQLREC